MKKSNIRRSREQSKFICIYTVWRYKNGVTDARSLCGANLLATAEASSSCGGCRKAHIYLQTECGKAVPFALPRREQYMWPSGQIYEEAIFTTQADGVLRYMRQAECSRIYAERNHVGKLAGATAQYMWRVSDEYTKKPT